MATASSDKGSSSEEIEPVSYRRAGLAALLAWLIPGLGHVQLGRRGRGAFFFALVVAALVIGCQLQGLLPWNWSGSPLQILATLGGMGSGLPFFYLHFTGYEGDLLAPGQDYGQVFLLTGGLMNLLLMLDAWDIGLGRKS